MPTTTTSRLKPLASIAVLASLLLAGLTACSDNDDRADSTPAGAGGESSVPAPTGTELVIGWLASETAAQSPTKDTSPRDTIDAWAKWTNGLGGINGHPVRVVFTPDDKGDPAIALANVKDLVENHKVIAIVGSNSLSQQAWADYVAERRVPVIGPQTGDALSFTNPMFYGVGGAVVANLWGQMKSAAEQGVNRIGLVLCTESPACAQARPVFKAMAEANGMEMTYDQLSSATQPSYTAECIAARESGAEAMAVFVNNVVFAGDCARQNFHPKWVSSEQGPWPVTIERVPALGESVGAASTWTCLGGPTEGTEDFFSAMSEHHPEYAVGKTKYLQYGPGFCRGWSAGEVFKRAIEKAGVAASAPATRDDVIRGLSMFDGEVVGSYTSPLTFGDGVQPNPANNCVYLYRYDGQELLRVPEGTLEPTCKPE